MTTIADAEEFDANAPETIRDPYPALARLRATKPTCWSPVSKAWYVTRYDDVRDGFRDGRLSADRIRPFCDARKDGPDGDALSLLGEHIGLWAVFNDPPRHTYLRRLMNRGFTSRAVEHQRDAIGDVVRGLIADWEDGAEIDFHREFAYPLPATVIALLLGVPLEDVDHLKRWSDALAQFVLTSKVNPEKYRVAADALKEMNAYFTDFLKARRKNPGDLVTDRLINAVDEDKNLSPDELVASCVLMLFAGHETTTQLIANGLLALIENPDQMAALRGHNAASPVTLNAVEEMLRYDGPSLTSPRLALKDIELRGETISAGERVWLWNAAANRDPDIFADPEKFDITRDNADQHVQFGYGIHFCLGAPLARLEAQIAFPILLDAFAGFELVKPFQDWTDSYVTRGMLDMPLRVRRA